MDEPFLKVAVKARIKVKINILAAVLRKDISVFVGELVQAAWEDAKTQGLVNEAMLGEPADASTELSAGVHA